MGPLAAQLRPAAKRPIEARLATSRGATLLFAAATTKGLLSLVAVVAALYPVTAVLLGRFLLGERVRRPQRLGAAAALVGVGTITT